MILLCIALMLALYWFIPQLTKKKQLYFVIAACTILVLYASLRAHNLQPDIPIYVRYYRLYSMRSLTGILSVFKSELKDPVYYFVAWVFSRVFSDPQFWLAFVALIYTLAVGFFLYKDSKNPLLSIIAFISLTYFEFSLSGLRQTLAMAFTTFAYFAVKHKKLIPFLALVFIASLFHRSALIFLLIYPIAHTKVGKWHAIVAGISGVLFLTGESYIRSLLFRYLEDTQYESYADRSVSLTISGFVIQLAIFVFCFVYYKAVLKKYEHANVLYNLAFLGLIFQLFSSMIAEVFRISMYFSIFNIALIPMAISAEGDKKTQFIETASIILLFIAYIFLNGVPPYEVFWR